MWVTAAKTVTPTEPTPGSQGTAAEFHPWNPNNRSTLAHYFGRFAHAAARCRSIFGDAGIAVAVVER
jgi:hypothetical protein